MTLRSLLLIAVLFSVPLSLVGAPPLTRAEADQLFANGDFNPLQLPTVHCSTPALLWPHHPPTPSP